MVLVDCFTLARMTMLWSLERLLVFQVCNSSLIHGILFTILKNILILELIIYLNNIL